MPKEDLFTNHELSWLNDSGSDSDVVLSSRVRLARNFRQIPFPNRANFEQLAEVQKLAGSVLEDIEGAMDEPFDRIAIEKLSSLEKNVLIEKHLISSNLVRNPQYRSAFISNDRRCSIMVNEEDHLRIQAMINGMALREAATMAFSTEDRLASVCDFSFDL